MVCTDYITRKNDDVWFAGCTMEFKIKKGFMQIFELRPVCQSFEMNEQVYDSLFHVKGFYKVIKG
jgi:hypothetical protein